MDWRRRDFITGLGGASLPVGSARAAAAFPPPAVLANRGFKVWTHMRSSAPMPLDLKLDTAAGRSMSLRDWLEGRPTILVLWATWCPPCMSEKGAQAKLQSRLIATGSPARIKSLQAYDDKTLAEGKAAVLRLGGASLDLARASAPMEKAFRAVFGKSPIDPARTSLPAMLLLAPDGRELGRRLGTMDEVRGKTYWEEDSTVAFLSSLPKLVSA